MFKIKVIDLNEIRALLYATFF